MLKKELENALEQERNSRLAMQEQVEQLQLEQVRLVQDNERRLQESNSLLEGLQVLATLDSAEMFRGLFGVLCTILDFEHACVILKQKDESFATIATTHPDFNGLMWQSDQFFQQIFVGNKTLSVFDVAFIPEWQPHVPLSFPIASALHMPIQLSESTALLIATHAERGFFTRDHLSLADRFRPMVVQALQNAELHTAIRTERDRLEGRVIERTQAAVESQKLYRTVIDTAMDAVVGMDKKGLITDWNQQAENIFGWSFDEAVGKPMHALIIPHKYRDAHTSGMANYFKTGEGPVLNTRIEIEARRRDGTLFPIELAITPITVEGDELFSGFIRDITHRKAAEEATEKAREEAVAANKAKSQFLANMSHEIRTPLNAVIGLSGLLIDSGLNDEQRDYVNTIWTSGNNLLMIINDILDFSKIEAGHMVLEKQAFDLRRTIEESLDLIAADAAQKKIDLAYTMSDDTPSFVVGDVTRLRQILINLLGNAVKFTASGEVVVSVRSVKEEDETRRLYFEVRDTGIGIAEDKQDRLFKAFSQVDASTTRQYGGTGLGLAITKRLCEMMGGEVSIESEVGKGSTFLFSVVMKDADMSADEQKRYAYLAEQQPQLEGLRVLIVDDNATNRHLLEKQLDVWGMVVVSAESGFEALGLLAVKEPFDVTILDVFMPRMDGVQLSGEIKKTHPDLPQIILSSSGRSDLGSVTLEVSAYLNKPLKPSQLYNALSNLFTGVGKMTKIVSTATEKKETIDKGLAEHHPLQILVAEDNLINQRVVLRLLERMGYQADVSANGREVLTALETQTYDVVLMDIQMPVMDGVEATQKIIEQYPIRPHIIAVTANALKGDRERYLAAGMDDYISKPIHIGALQRALRETPLLQDSQSVQAVPPPDCSPIDKAFMAEQYGDMAEDMLVELLPLFRDEAEQLWVRLQAAGETNDVQAVREVAHALKGASFGVGAIQLAELCKGVETAARNREILHGEFTAIGYEIERIKRYE